MSEQKKIDSYFRTKKFPIKSPCKKKIKDSIKNSPKTKAKKNLLLLELFTAKPQDNNEKCEIKFLSTGRDVGKIAPKSMETDYNKNNVNNRTIDEDYRDQITNDSIDKISIDNNDLVSNNNRDQIKTNISDEITKNNRSRINKNNKSVIKNNNDINYNNKTIELDNTKTNINKVENVAPKYIETNNNNNRCIKINNNNRNNNDNNNINLMNIHNNILDNNLNNNSIIDNLTNNNTIDKEISNNKILNKELNNIIMDDNKTIEFNNTNIIDDKFIAPKYIEINNNRNRYINTNINNSNNNINNNDLLNTNLTNNETIDKVLINNKTIDNNKLNTKTIDINSVNNKTIDINTVNNNIIDINTVNIKTIDNKTVNNKTIDINTVNNETIDKDLINNNILNAPTKTKPEFNPIKTESSRKRLFVDSNAKESEPAYKRFANLCNKIPQPILTKTNNYFKSSNLYLPLRYQRLYDIFVCADTILRIYKTRAEKCTFDKLKIGVELMTKILFDKTALAQILWLYTEFAHAYLSSTKNADGTRDLILEITEDSSEAVVLSRREEFRRRLVDRVHFYHSEFLREIGAKINPAEIKRWHPKFKIEEIPDVETIVLPEAEKPKIFSAKEMLNLTIFQEGKIKEILEQVSNDFSPNKIFNKIFDQNSRQNFNNNFSRQNDNLISVDNNCFNSRQNLDNISRQNGKNFSRQNNHIVSADNNLNSRQNIDNISRQNEHNFFRINNNISHKNIDNYSRLNNHITSRHNFEENSNHKLNLNFPQNYNEYEHKLATVLAPKISNHNFDDCENNQKNKSNECSPIKLHKNDNTFPSDSSNVKSDKMITSEYYKNSRQNLAEKYLKKSEYFSNENYDKNNKISTEKISPHKSDKLQKSPDKQNIDQSINTPNNNIKLQQTPDNKINNNTVNSPLKFVSTSLLSRIREKERILNEKAMKKDVNHDILVTKIEKIPEIMRCTYNYFISERKPFLILSKVCSKICDSCLPDLSIDKIEEYYHIMKKYIPDWVEFVNLHGVEYLGIKFQKININDAINLFKQATKDLS